MRRILMPLLFISALTACHRFGTWSDDPKNWERAWGDPKPADIVMPHSWYWRSPHFTREEAYFFEFQPNATLQKGLIGENSLRMIAPVTKTTVAPDYCFPKPVWFSPEPLDQYEIWQGGNVSNIWLLRSRNSGEMYLYSCQL